MHAKWGVRTALKEWVDKDCWRFVEMETSMIGKIDLSPVHLSFKVGIEAISITCL